MPSAKRTKITITATSLDRLKVIITDEHCADIGRSFVRLPKGPEDLAHVRHALIASAVMANQSAPAEIRWRALQAYIAAIAPLDGIRSSAALREIQHFVKYHIAPHFKELSIKEVDGLVKELPIEIEQTQPAKAA